MSKRQPSPACIYTTNPAGGFINSHRRFCTYCDADATKHVYLRYWCGNVCGAHVKRGIKGSEILDGVIVAHDDSDDATI